MQSKNLNTNLFSLVLLSYMVIVYSVKIKIHVSVTILNMYMYTVFAN